MKIGGSSPEVDRLLTELSIGAQAVDHIKKRAVYQLEQGKDGSYWHTREMRDILSLAQFTYGKGDVESPS